MVENFVVNPKVVTECMTSQIEASAKPHLRIDESGGRRNLNSLTIAPPDASQDLCCHCRKPLGETLRGCVWCHVYRLGLPRLCLRKEARS